MNDTYTGAISLSIFGESHGPAVGATLSGLAAGVPVDEAYIAREMDKRRAAGRLSTKRTEPDRVHFLSGVYKGFTTGTAVTLVIENTNTRSEDYEKTQDLLRPGHADWTAHLKYRGFQDARGGGHFSGPAHRAACGRVRHFEADAGEKGRGDWHASGAVRRRGGRAPCL